MDCLYNLTLAQQTNTTAGSIFNKLGYSQSQTTVKEDITTLLSKQQNILDNLALIRTDINALSTSINRNLYDNVAIIRTDINALSTSINSKLDENQAQQVASLTNCIQTVNNISSTIFDNHNIIRADISNVQAASDSAVTEIQEHRSTDVITVTDKVAEVKAETSIISIIVETIKNMDIPSLAGAVGNSQQVLNTAINQAKNETLNSQSELSNDIITIINQIKDKLIELFDYVDDFDEGYNICVTEGATEQDRIREQFELQFNQYCIDNFGEVIPFPIEPPPRRPGKVIPIKPPIPGGIGKKLGWIIGLIEQLTDLQLYLQLVDTWGTIRMGGRTFGNNDNADMLEMLYRSLGMKDYVKKGWDLLPTAQKLTRYDFLKDGGLKEQIRVNKEGKVEWNGWLKMKTVSGKDIYLTGALIDCLATVADLAWMSNNNK